MSEIKQEWLNKAREAAFVVATDDDVSTILRPQTTARAILKAVAPLIRADALRETDEAIANAHLIAAAPELLEALEALNATIDAFWNDPSQSKSRPSERHMKAITLAQVESYKAVVKARGEVS